MFLRSQEVELECLYADLLSFHYAGAPETRSVQSQLSSPMSIAVLQHNPLLHMLQNICRSFTIIALGRRVQA